MPSSAKLLGVLLGLQLFGSVVQAQTYYVSTTADDGPGSLRKALQDANAEPEPDPRATIEFRTAFPLGGRILLETPLPALTRNAMIHGMWRKPVIDARGAFPILRFAAPVRDVSLWEIELANGKAEEKGGCVDGTGVASNARLYAVDSVFQNCVAESTTSAAGGAIYWPGSELQLRYDRFIANQARASGGVGRARGGAVAAEPNTVLYLEGVRFELNHADAVDGEGGDLSFGGRGRVLASSSTGARAGNAGGSVALRCATATCMLEVERSYFRGAQAAAGGALWAFGSTDALAQLRIENSTLMENTAVSGGALALIRTGIDARHLTLLRNSATWGAHLVAVDSVGAVFANSALDEGLGGPGCSGALAGSPQAVGTVVETADCVATLGGGSRVPSLKYIQTFGTGSQVPVPFFAADSPVVDAGDPAFCLDHDFLGRPRPVDGDNDGRADCDAGVYEHPNRIRLYANGFEL